MILRSQQIVDLFRINRGLDELEGHQEKDTPLAEDVNGGFFLFLAQRQRCGTAEVGLPERSERETLPAVATTVLCVPSMGTL